MKIQKVLVIFKTHLDIGFTDLAKNVTEKYLNSFIPGAIKTAKTLKSSATDARFVWTTGSWLISEYLRTKSAEECAELERAIKNGDICWHGLPFTTHTELMSAELFNYGLSLSKRLDECFGKKTTAAKMTDVPGHTKAIIKHMSRAGIEFLHIGVNPASTPPDVPSLFRWRNDSGEEIMVMYQGDYGEYSEIGNSGIAVYFAHAHDNAGVQSPDEVTELYGKLKSKFPDAEIIAADLNLLAEEVKKIKSTLPILTDEIGDTWIHGVATDPKKVSCFRGLERLWKSIEESPDYERLARGLIMIPEHTWGLDEKITLHDNRNYARKDFEKARSSPEYRRMETSWEEQRNYLYSAARELSAENREKAERVIAESCRRPADISGLEKISPDGTVFLGDFEIKFNEAGEICFLKNGDLVIADESNRLCTLMYEQFGAEDYERFYKQYIRADYDWSDAGFDWAKEDFTKPGIEAALKRHIEYMPKCEVFYGENKAVVIYAFPNVATEQGGCPRRFDLEITASDNELHFDLAWFEKTANRIAEAIWFGFNPKAENKKIGKLGQFIDPAHIVLDGQRSLHATDCGIKYDELFLKTEDTALVAPEKPSLLNFTNELPNKNSPVYFNLYNNVWGTNFPMWYGEDARFRFTVKI